MNNGDLIIHMLRQLDEQTISIQQVGAGYYSCIPFTRRFNKLLEQARSLFPASDGLIGTFDEIEAQDPKDPSEKMKVIQSIRVEIGQLIALLEISSKEDAQ